MMWCSLRHVKWVGSSISSKYRRLGGPRGWESGGSRWCCGQVGEEIIGARCGTGVLTGGKLLRSFVEMQEGVPHTCLLASVNVISLAQSTQFHEVKLG